MAQTMNKVWAASLGLALAGSVFAAAPTVSTEVVVDKIDSPWDMAFMKDGTMFFTEKCKGLSVRMPTGAVNKLHGWAPRPATPRQAPTSSATVRPA